MNGFKSGASEDDPYNGEDSDETTDSVDGMQQATREQVTSASEQASSTRLPWIYRRSSITDGREKTVQLHLQQSTLERERDTLADVEATLGESVNKADLREAAYLVGLQRLNAVADELREWGYDTE